MSILRCMTWGKELKSKNMVRNHWGNIVVTIKAKVKTQTQGPANDYELIFVGEKKGQKLWKTKQCRRVIQR